jgi:hypothetical protein
MKKYENKVFQEPLVKKGQSRELKKLFNDLPCFFDR